MAPRELVFYNYSTRFWDGAVRVKLEDIVVGDVLIIGDCRHPGCYPSVDEVCVMAVNANKTVTVIKRAGGDVESVKLRDLWRPDWFKMPYRYLSLGPRRCQFRRPLLKDDMLKHGVEVEPIVEI